MDKKRGSTKGFDGGIETERRCKNWTKNKPQGDWRKVDKIKLEYTVLERTWSWSGVDDDTYTEKHVAPWGMVKEATESLKSENVGNSYKTLPTDVKDHFSSLSPINFNKDDVTVAVTNSGNMGFSTFSFLYCSICKAKSLIPFMKEFQDMLPNHATVEDVLCNWDKIKEKKKFVKTKYHKSMCGCLIPNDPEVNAGPSAKQFITRPIEHTNVHQKFVTAATDPKDGPTLPKKSKPNSSLVVSTGGSRGATGTVQTEEVVEVVVTDKSGESSTKYLKNKGKKVRTTFISSYLEKDLGMHEVCKDENDIYAKEFAMDLILTGCQKMVSQASSITYYNTVMKGMKGAHEVIFGRMTLNGRKIKGIPKLSLNENNVNVMQHSILNAYTSLDISPNETLRQPYGKYYSIMHDGIQKFSRELNGVHLRTVKFDDDGVDVVIVPWKLTEIPGGSLNALKLCTHVWNTMSTVKSPEKNAFESFIEAQRSLGVSELEIVNPPHGDISLLYS